MRSGMNPVNSSQVHQWAIEWLLQAELLKARGRVCAAVVVWRIVLRAASRTTSICAACQDLADAPSSQAVFDALEAGLPRTLPLPEQRLNDALLGHLPQRMHRRSWQVAIDWHQVPYYGKPPRSPNELYRSRPLLGTTTFYCCATICVVEYGRRYTLALICVRGQESKITVLRRLVHRIGQIGLKIKLVLLDRAFFSVNAAAFVQQGKLPFSMPAAIRGPKPKKTRPLTGLPYIRRQKAGWYEHTMSRGKRKATVPICVAYRTYPRPGEKKQRNQKLLLAGCRVNGSRTDIPEPCPRRFGIETSYRQRRLARVYTSTPDPNLRLVFVAMSLLLRNLWLWTHESYLKNRGAETFPSRLNRLRSKRLPE